MKLLRVVPAEGNTAQAMFFGAKVSKMQIISLVSLQSIKSFYFQIKKSSQGLQRNLETGSLKGI